MRSGDMWHEVAVEQRGDTRNAHGESVASWSSFTSNIYCKIMNLSGNELIQAQQINSRINTKFITRFDDVSDGIRATMRLVFKSRNYGILWLDNVDERDKELHIYCERLEDNTNG
jgi:SPP1 family predicted phage head-tail adaptor